MALVAARGRVEDDDAVVDVAVGDEELVRSAIDEHVCGRAEILRVVAAGTLAVPSDLQHELAGARELQDLRVLLAAARDPDMVGVVDVDAVLEVRPFVALSDRPRAGTTLRELEPGAARQIDRVSFG